MFKRKKVAKMTRVCEAHYVQSDLNDRPLMVMVPNNECEVCK